MTNVNARIDVYKAKSGKHRWRLWIGSRIFASSGEDFAKRGNAIRAARKLKEMLEGEQMVFVRFVEDD